MLVRLMAFTSVRMVVWLNILSSYIFPMSILHSISPLLVAGLAAGINERGGQAWSLARGGVVASARHRKHEAVKPTFRYMIKFIHMFFASLVVRVVRLVGRE